VAPPEDEPGSRIVEETTELHVLKPVMQRSKNNWQFVWNGQKISAPVLDQDWYARYVGRSVPILPGDTLLVRMRMRQRRLPDLNVWVTERYEIVEVIKRIEGHAPGDAPQLGLSQPKRKKGA
jgi:hypothetical protein